MGPLRLLLALGAVLVAAFALAWNDALPGGDAIRGLLVDEAARAEQDHRVHRAARLSAFASEGAPRADVLLIGGDLIERSGPGLLRGTGLAVVERGIAGEPLFLLAERVQPAIRETGPALVVLDAGRTDAMRPTASDAWSGGEVHWRAPADLAAEVGRVLDEAFAERPELRFLLLEALPDAAGERAAGDRVRALNAALRGVAATRPRVDLVRTWREPIVDAAAGSLRPAAVAPDGRVGETAQDALRGWLRAHPWVAEVAVAARAGSEPPANGGPDDPPGGR